MAGPAQRCLPLLVRIRCKIAKRPVQRLVQLHRVNNEESDGQMVLQGLARQRWQGLLY